MAATLQRFGVALRCPRVHLAAGLAACQAPLLSAAINHPTTSSSRTLMYASKKYHNPPPRRPPTNKQYKYDFRVLRGVPYTHKPFNIPRLGGRNPEDRKKYNQRVGGGIKWDWFWIQPIRPTPSDGSEYEEKVLEIKKDPNYAAFVALCAGVQGRVWRFATENMRVGQIIKSSSYIPDIPVNPVEGNAYALGALPPGTSICCIQKYRLANSEVLVWHAGLAATILRKQDDMVIIRLPYKHEISVKQDCQATVGRLSNDAWNSLHWGSMNAKRRAGIKQGSGLYHKKDGYCGRKVHPLPPLKAFVQPEVDERELFNVTLDKYDLSAKFGPGRMDKLYSEEG